MIRLVSVLFLVVAASSDLPRYSSRILGGADANIRNFPYVASVENRVYGHECGGTVLNSNWVLTDSWCTLDPNVVEKFLVRVGSGTLGRGIAHNITQWLAHPLANLGEYFGSYDFVLINVDPPIEFSSSVAAVGLPALNEETPDGVVATVAGWGRINMNEFNWTVNELHYANLTLVGDDRCATILGSNYNETILCTQGVNEDTALCWRDGGAPLVVRGLLYGVAHWYSTCANPQDVQKFARVASVMDWISATIVT